MTTQLLEYPTLTDEELAEIVDALTRRELLTGGATLGALGLGLATCGSSTHPGGQAATGWRYTDDLGRKVTLRAEPKRLAVLGDNITATLWSLGLHKIVASPLDSDLNAELVAAGVPIKSLIKLGDASGINLEELAAVKPDLVVDLIQDGKLATTSQHPQIAKIAPVVGLNVNSQPVENIIASARRLTMATGEKFSDQAGFDRYTRAANTLRAVLRSRPDLTVLFCFGDASDLYDMIPDKWPFMQTLAQLGMRFTPAAAGPQDTYQAISWERVDELHADLIVDALPLAPSNPAWQAMPAVVAGNVMSLPADSSWYVYTYSGYAAIFDQLSAAIEAAQPKARRD